MHDTSSTITDEVTGVEAADFLPVGFRFDGDFLVHFMTVPIDATVAEVCTAAAGWVSDFRVPPRPGSLQLTFKGMVQPGDRPAREVGIGWLDYVQIDVIA